MYFTATKIVCHKNGNHNAGMQNRYPGWSFLGYFWPGFITYFCINMHTFGGLGRHFIRAQMVTKVKVKPSIQTTDSEVSMLSNIIVEHGRLIIA